MVLSVLQATQPLFLRGRGPGAVQVGQGKGRIGGKGGVGVHACTRKVPMGHLHAALFEVSARHVGRGGEGHLLSRYRRDREQQDHDKDQYERQHA